MFCSNCGKQIPDGSKFCNFCGGKQVLNTTSTSPEADAKQFTSTNSKVNKNTNKNSSGKTDILTKLIIGGLVLLVGGFVGKTIIAPSLAGTDNTLSGNRNTIETFTTVECTLPEIQGPYMINPDYNNVLSDAGIVRVAPSYNMDNDNFVRVEKDGKIRFYDFGYRDDMIVNCCETIYYPISGLTESQKTENINIINTNMQFYKNISCCTATSEMGSDYYIIKIEYNDLDNEENRKEYCEKILNKSVGFISMEESEKDLLENGAIKKRMT